MAKSKYNEKSLGNGAGISKSDFEVLILLQLKRKELAGLIHFAELDLFP